ncbi:MAG: permease-like cell division protein FtsX [Clostridium sp.]|nr:permease-like cell division protein FtsX [Clostridium sp.]
MAKLKSGKISTLGSQVTSVISVALVLLILGVLAAASITTRKLNHSLMSNVSVIAKMSPEASPEDESRAAAAIKSQPFAAEVTFTAADEVLAQEMEHSADVLEIIGENPYSSEFEVKLAPQYVHPDSITVVSNRLMFIDGVEEVVSQADMVKAMSAISSKGALVLSCIAIVLLVISIVLIYNTVSIAVYARRFVIRTMQLVGATSGFIRRPFLVAGAWWGVFAGVIASSLLWALACYVRSLDIDLDFALGLGDLCLVSLGLIIIGVAICLAATYCATTRYLRASYDVLYAS